MDDFLSECSSAELTDWIEYEKLERELTQKSLEFTITRAIIRAFKGNAAVDKPEKKLEKPAIQQKTAEQQRLEEKFLNPALDIDYDVREDGPIIDSTTEDFAKHFQGFSNGPATPPAQLPLQGRIEPHTRILYG